MKIDSNCPITENGQDYIVELTHPDGTEFSVLIPINDPGSFVGVTPGKPYGLNLVVGGHYT